MKKNIKISIIQIICFTLICIGFSINKANAESQLVPEIAFINIDHSPLVQGDTENFYITSKNVSKVQYRVFLYTEQTDTTEEVTQGYTNFVNANMPYKVACNHKFDVGSHKVTVWVKGENSNAEYDNTAELTLNCVERDDSNRVYTSGEILTDKNEYLVGDKVQINGISNISGMYSPYSYKVNVYNATKNEWENGITNYGQHVSWTPKEAGVYILDLWTLSMDSTLWKTLDNDANAKVYEGWKFKVISVKNTSDIASITQVIPVKDTITEGTSYSLPNTVTAVLSDGSTKSVSVKWNPSNIDTNTPGTFNFEGKTEDFSGTASCTVTVAPKVNQYNNPYIKYIGKWSLKDSNNNDVVTWNIENIDTDGNLVINILKFLPEDQYGSLKAAIIYSNGTINNNELKAYFDNDGLDNNGYVEASFKDDHIELNVNIATSRSSNDSIWVDGTYTLKKD